jgi:spore coat protein CotF
MPFGAMETMVSHEILSEKICMLDHFALYASQCQDPQLKQMLNRHMQTALQSYNQLVSYTHDYQNTPVQFRDQFNVSPQTVQYGLQNPSPESPQMQGSTFTDKQIAASVLSSHKNSAKNHMAAATECADPNVRQLFINGSVTCCNQAYEVFLYMNQRGMYQVPTLKDHTAKTMLHHYQPVPMQGQMSEQQQPMGINQGGGVRGQMSPYNQSNQFHFGAH